MKRLNGRLSQLLVGWLIVSAAFLIIIEGIAAMNGLPSISDRLAQLNANGGEVFVIWAAFTVGLMFGHWWAGVRTR